MSEVWRSIPGFAGYEASSLGRVRSHWDHGGNLRRRVTRVLNPKPNRYLSTKVKTSSPSGFHGYIGLHRLVALAFLGPPADPRAFACHRNGIKTDNRPENLRWDNPAGNAVDAIRHGALLKGQDMWSAKLGPELVVAIRWLAANDRASRSELARLFGIGKDQVGNILKGKSWRHLFTEAPKA